MIEKIRQLREDTGASFGEIKAAIDEAGGDAARAREILAAKLGRAAQKKKDREVKSGVVDAYIHANGRIGVVVEVLCETDFVARNPEFRELAHHIAMHIAAMDPETGEALLEQEFIRDSSQTVGGLIQQAIGKFGENIRIEKFSRLEL